MEFHRLFMCRVMQPSAIIFHNHHWNESSARRRKISMFCQCASYNPSKYCMPIYPLLTSSVSFQLFLEPLF